uniref:YobI family P-loop NTPase n=1 Tax=Acetatifactor sp. TaxID=1872090 RepID=UPI0040562231
MSAQKYKFLKLTPTDDVALGIYEDAFAYAFKQDDICNIAITGSYGAGKSSVIETYKKKHPEKKFLHISLAHFAESKREEQGSRQSVSTISETELEGKIINQLVHQIPSEKIPQTNFALKKKINENHVMKYTIFAMVFLVLCCFVWFHDAWSAMVRGFQWTWLKMLLAFTTSKEMVLICLMGCITMLAFLCYQLIAKQLNRNFLQKMNIKGNNFDIELFDEKVESYFDKYLNEVLYLFENVGADVIVFEDMDRYENNLIFEKLREINVLLNRRTGPIRFAYLLRDDMFVTKDRTKFFDFVIPVVPVVDGSNSLDMFLAYFEESGIKELFQLEFLQGLSLYVDDMRILKNICNEFLIYRAKLQERFVGQDDKLLAMIVYKNIFPKDFADLQVEQGYVYQLFRVKDEYAQKEIEAINERIKVLEETEKLSGQELSRNMDELDALYFVDSRPMKVNNKTVEQFSSRAEFIAAIKENNYGVTVGRPYYSNDYTWNSANIKDKFDKLSSNEEYARRKKIMEQKHDAEKKKRNLQLLKHRNRLENLEYTRLKDVITKENAEAIFEAPTQKMISGEKQFDEIKRNPYFPLIKYLIWNGYIDENYHDYMTFFYENSISKEDKIFLRGIADREGVGCEHPLRNPELVISRMQLRDFETEEGRNYMLLDFLLEKRDLYEMQLEHFMSGIWNWEPTEFVDGYIRRGRNIRAFAQELNETWRTVILWMLQEETFSEESRMRYLLYTLCDAEEELLQECNERRELTAYINVHHEILDVAYLTGTTLSKEDIEEFSRGLELLNVKFLAINAEIADAILLWSVYIKQLYALTEHNIELFLEHMYHILVSEEYQTRNLSLILSQEQPLAEYVKENLSVYVKLRLSVGRRLVNEAAEEWETEASDVEEVTVAPFAEDPNAVLLVLNATTVEKQEKLDFISLLNTKLSKLSEVQDKELWQSLLSANLCNSLENFGDYFFLSGNGLDEPLAEYVNKFENEPILNIAEWKTIYGEDAANRLFQAIIKCDKLSDAMLCSLLSGFAELASELALESPEKEKVQLTAEEMERVLSVDISDVLKIKLLECESAPVSVMHKNYSEEVLLYILKHNLDEQELEQLYCWYPKEMPCVQEAILEFALGDIDVIVMFHKTLHPALLDALLQAENISLDNKKHLLADGMLKIPELTEAKVRAYLRFLELMDFDSLFIGKRPVVDATEANKALLEALQKRGWVSSFEVDKEDSSQYRIYGKKSRVIKIG